MRITHMLTIVTLAMVVGVSSAQTTLFEDDFSSGTQDGWVQMTNGASAFTYAAGVATIVPAAG